jgi:hypothetical protein
MYLKVIRCDCVDWIQLAVWRALVTS